MTDGVAQTRFEQVLTAIENLPAMKNSVSGSRNQRVRGIAFEQASKFFLENDPAYASQFQTVWMWEDSGNPLKSQVVIKGDTGIDLVAKSQQGDYWSIQCKYYDSDSQLGYKEVSTFLSTSDALGVAQDHQILITTAGDLSAILRENLTRRNAVVINQDQLNNRYLDWSPFIQDDPGHRKRYDLRPHQERAIEDCLEGFKTSDRGKLIMACGTGKTLTSLRLAERMRADRDRTAPELENVPYRILFLAPSIALVAQSFHYWTQQAKENIAAFVVCSDTTANKNSDDTLSDTVLDIGFPTTTNPQILKNHLKVGELNHGLTVVFSTYQSIDTTIDAQKCGMPPFDLVICDEAHRTAGVGDNRGEQSAFVKVHNDDLIHAKKRLYMTATPRVYSANAQTKAQQNDFRAFSMDDERIFGPEFHRLKFGTAVAEGILTDYRVLVLGIPESQGSGLRGQLTQQSRMNSLFEKYHQTLARKKVAESTRQNAQRKLSELEGQAETMASKIIGAWDALMTKGDHFTSLANRIDSGLGDQVQFALLNRDTFLNAGTETSRRRTGKGESMHTAVAFTRTINDSIDLAEGFSDVVKEYIADTVKQGNEKNLPSVLIPEVRHVDGSMSSKERKEKLSWLADRVEDPDGCRILSNAKCLTEGVDLPLLDAVIFFQPRKSQVDIIQAVGRVMRKADNKRYGYVILPVVVPDAADPDDILSQSDFSTVWEILQALRSHDERLDARINTLSLHRAEVQSKRRRQSTQGSRRAGNVDQDDVESGALSSGSSSQYRQTSYQGSFDFNLSEGIQAQIVKKCGDTAYWDDWTDSVANIAIKTRQIITDKIASNPTIKREFDAFLQGLRDTLNPGISREEAIGMLAQHILTAPIFDALFGSQKDAQGRSFVENNPVSQALRPITDLLQPSIRQADTNHDLSNLYSQVRISASAVQSDETARQRLVRNLYESFFKSAFADDSQKLGIVYTPKEVVDYILHAVNAALRQHFNSSLGDDGVTVLDPFTGTGTFIVELLRSGLIPYDRLSYKYRNEIFANEIMLLAYYIAMVNIESEYHAVLEGRSGASLDYEPFEGGVLADTFQMTEENDSLDQKVFAQNSNRVERQNKQPITVILGNPPYSAGQKNANDNNANDAYPNLDKRISETYAAGTRATNTRQIFDSYIRAFRWASDRISGRNATGAKDKKGLICFVSGGGWLENTAFNGFRNALVEEFSDIYVLNLLGNKEFRRLTREELKRQGDNIFGSQSKTSIAITLLVSNPESGHHGIIHYRSIGDYLTRDQKLDELVDFTDNPLDIDWQIIKPDKHGDWLNQRDDVFYEYMPMGLEKWKSPTGIFRTYSLGIATGRDAFSYGFSRYDVENRMKGLISEYNRKLDEWEALHDHNEEVSAFTTRDVDKSVIKWNRSLQNQFKRGDRIDFSRKFIAKSMYRPFVKEWLYYDSRLIERMYRNASLFPLELVSEANSYNPDDVQECERMYRNATSPSLLNSVNKCIVITGKSNSGFSALAMRDVTCLDTIQKGQNFPLYWYEKIDKTTDKENILEIDDEKHAHAHLIVASDGTRFIRHDAITDEALSVFRQAYPGNTLLDLSDSSKAKEEIFYYIYGILHSSEYRSRFGTTLRKELARIPLANDFTAFAKAGRKLAQLHLSYEDAPKYKGEGKIQEEWTDGQSPLVETFDDFTVSRLVYGKTAKTVDNPEGIDRTRIIYNQNLTLSGIPEDVYEYKVSGRAPLEWVMDQYQEKIDSVSGNISNPNNWIRESGNPRYLVDLIESLATVSLKTIKIVKGLPELNELPQTINWPISWRQQDE